MYTPALTKPFVGLLRERKLVPANIELSEVGNLYVVNAYDSEQVNVIAQYATTGIDQSSRLALIKALTEYSERNAIHYHFNSNPRPALVENGSDGCAAFPIFGNQDFATKKARENAYCEALERYVWATWWDNNEIRAQTDVADENDADLRESIDCIKLIESQTPLQSLHLIRPEHSDKQTEVIILFAELKSGGWISGGAAGLIGKTSTTVFRGMSEMIRHSMGYARMVKKNIEPKTFYEKRLHYFASGAGNELVGARINSRGLHSIELPPLKVDMTIDHPNSDIMAVHRVLFENQPLFVGGALERLCL